MCTLFGEFYHQNNLLTLMIDSDDVELGIAPSSQKNVPIDEGDTSASHVKVNEKYRGARIEVINLSYGLPNGKKQLLHNINLLIKPGDMVALMGPSGAGKSTLLDLIANRKINGELSGSILINGTIWSKSFHRETTYCLQDDMHFPIFTVEETIQYAAWTRMPLGTTTVVMAERVDLLINLMGLSHVRKTRVGGSSLKGISGGQMKRLSIAVEIISLPNLIFLDEPTSGLDSAIALKVMKTVRFLANEGSTVLVTVHQPSNETFALFNKVAFLAAGRMVYFGPTADLVSYFSSQALGFELPSYIIQSTSTTLNTKNDSSEEMPIEHNQLPGSKYFNISDFVLEVCSEKVESVTVEGRKYLSASELEQHYLQSSVYKTIASEMTALRDSVSIGPDSQWGDSNPANALNHESSFITQFCMCLHRAVMAQIKDTELLKYLVFSNLAMGLLIGIIFVGQGKLPSEPLFPGGFLSTSVINFSYMLAALFFYGYTLSQAIMHSLTHKIILYDREMKAGAYNVVAVWLAEVIQPVGFIFLLNLIYFIPAFFLIQLPVTSSSFFFIFFMVYLLRLITYYLIMWFIAWSRDENIALLGYFVVADILEYVFNGIAVLPSALPTFWIFAPYISYFRYAMQGSMQFYFSGYTTDDDGLYTTGNGDVLAYYSFNAVPQNFNFLVLVAFMVGHSLAALYFMRQPTSQIKYVTIDNQEHNADSSSTSAASTDLSPTNNVPTQHSNQPEQMRTVSRVQIGESFSLSSRPSLLMTVSARLTNLSPMHSNSSVRGVGLQAFRANSTSVRLPRTRSVDSDLMKEIYDEPVLTVEYFRQHSSVTKPSSGCTLAFRDVHYHTDSNMHILNGVSGIVKPGEMCAMLGASGAGKSTLLEVLAARKTTGRVTGDILFNGKPCSPEILKASAYIMQDNIHFSKLTVRETIRYSAELRLRETMPRAEKDERVQQIIDMLGLSRVSESLIGNSYIRGISGGQLKRVSIAVEIVNLPDLIFLDEPTTGLDGTTALEVMSAIRNLANQHRTVLFTIHSPSVEIGKLFDHLFLVQSGRIAYFGPCADVASFFISSPFELPVTFSCEKNPFEDLVTIAGTLNLTYKMEVSSDNSSEEDDKAGVGVASSLTLCEYYLQSVIFASVLTQLDDEFRFTAPASVVSGDEETPFSIAQSSSIMVSNTDSPQTQLSGRELVAKRSYLTSPTHQVKTLVHRSLTLWTQSKTTLAGFYLASIFFGIFYGWVWFQAGSLQRFSEADITYNMVFLLFQIPLTYFFLQQMWVAEVIDSRLIFYRERGASACGVVAFWMSCWVVPTIYTVTSALPFSVIAFFMTSMATNDAGTTFGWYFLFNVFTGLVSLYAMLTLAAVSPTIEIAHTILPLWLCFTVNFAGLSPVITNLPNWLYYWAPFLNFSRWSYQGLMLNEFLNNPTFDSSGQDTIDSFAFNTYDIGAYAGILVGFTFGYLALMLACMIYFDFEKR